MELYKTRQNMYANILKTQDDYSAFRHIKLKGML